MASHFLATDAHGYERIMGRFSAELARSFLDFTGHPPGDHILDVGCGTGGMTFALAERGDHDAITGVDLSEVYLEHARGLNDDSRITFEIADATCLPFDADSFDRAVCQLVLQFLPDPLPAVLEMKRVVRAGGQVAACVWDSFGGMPQQRMLWDTASALGYDRARTLLRPLTTGGELGAMWREAGLTDVTEDMITMRFRYADFDDYWSSLASGQGPPGEFIASLAESDRERLAAQLRHVYLSGKPDGARSFLAGAWICKGTVPAP